MKVVNEEHKSMEEHNLPNSCKKCSKRFWVLLGFSCSCRKLRKQK